MQLPDCEKDRLTEMINIGYGRAADALSRLIGERIVLHAPVVELHSIPEVTARLSELVGSRVSSVHQSFGGPVEGHALLLLDCASADILLNLVLKNFSGGDVRAAARDAFAELGNIVLQAAIGICGTMLDFQVSFAVPNVSIEAISELLGSLVIGTTELQYALLIRTCFQVAEKKIQGYLAVVLGFTSYSRLLTELDNWEARQALKWRLQQTPATTGR